MGEVVASSVVQKWFRHLQRKKQPVLQQGGTENSIIMKSFKMEFRNVLEKLLSRTMTLELFRADLLLHGMGSDTVRAYQDLNRFIKNV